MRQHKSLPREAYPRGYLKKCVVAESAIHGQDATSSARLFEFALKGKASNNT